MFLAILEGDRHDHLQILLAAALAWAFVTLAFFAGSLTLDGRHAAFVAGTFVLGLGGWTPALLLLLFFLSSVLFSRAPVEADVVHGRTSLSVRRDGAQVWANGFWPVVTVVAWFLTGNELWLLLTAAVIAEVTADTWASELGFGKGVPTRLISTLQRVPPGTDGGISLRGTIAALCGAALIALAYLALTGSEEIRIFAIIAASGFAGSLIDSVLGAWFAGSGNNRLRRSVDDATPDELNNITNWLGAASAVIAAAVLTFLF